MTEPGKELDLSIIEPLLKKNGVSLDQYMGQLLAFKEAAGLTTPSEAPPVPHLDSGEMVAYTKLLELQENPQWPDEAREATSEEREWICQVREQVRILEAAIERQKENIKEAAHIHFDRVAQRTGKVNETTLKNKDGHYWIEDKSSWAVTGTKDTLHRLAVPGPISYGTPVISADRWLELYENGEIDRKTYLRYTEAVRVLDTDKMLLDAKKNPDLFRLIAKITRGGTPVVKIVAAD